MDFCVFHQVHIVKPGFSQSCSSNKCCVDMQVTESASMHLASFDAMVMTSAQYTLDSEHT